MTALAIIHKADIIEKVAQGVKLKVIAKDYGISAPALSQQLTNDPDYKQARIMGLSQRLDDRETEVEEASDMLNLARSKELLSHARWRCETEGRDVWSKQQPAININLGNSQSVIDADLYASAWAKQPLVEPSLVVDSDTPPPDSPV